MLHQPWTAHRPWLSIHTENYWHRPHSVYSRVYETVRSLSIRLSVPAWAHSRTCCCGSGMQEIPIVAAAAAGSATLSAYVNNSIRTLLTQAAVGKHSTSNGHNASTTAYHKSQQSTACIQVYPLLMTRSETHTHPFNGPLSGTTRVSRYQKGKTNLDFTETRDSEWQWNPLGHMQVCTSLQTDNHASTSPLSFFTGRMPFLLANQQRQSTEDTQWNSTNEISHDMSETMPVTTPIITNVNATYTVKHAK